MRFVFPVLIVLSVGAAAQPPDKRQILERVGDYVRSYEAAFSAVVCEEHYSQRARVENGWQQRVLRSEVALIRADDNDWRLFRDVIAVDGAPLEDRGDRLKTLFSSPQPGAAAEAYRITEESARYNIGPVTRTMNIPTLALAFLRAEHQKRSAFTLGSRGRSGGRDVVDLQFEERDTPRMIYTRDRAAATGRAWVDTADGTISGTELRIHSENMLATMLVMYRRDDTLGLWVPESMEENYYSGVRRSDTGVASFDRTPSNLGVLLSAHARYSNCRRFSVTSRVVKGGDGES